MQFDFNKCELDLKVLVFETQELEIEILQLGLREFVLGLWVLKCELREYEFEICWLDKGFELFAFICELKETALGFGLRVDEFVEFVSVKWCVEYVSKIEW